jgi:hypothetical protein
MLDHTVSKMGGQPLLFNSKFVKAYGKVYWNWSVSFCIRYNFCPEYYSLELAFSKFRSKYEQKRKRQPRVTWSLGISYLNEKWRGSTEFREDTLHTIPVLNAKQAQASILSAPVISKISSRSNILFVTSVTISPRVYDFHAAEQSCSYAQNPSGQLLWWMQYFSLLFMDAIVCSPSKRLPLIHIPA